MYEISSGSHGLLTGVKIRRESFTTERRAVQYKLHVQILFSRAGKWASDGKSRLYNGWDYDGFQMLTRLQSWDWETLHYEVQYGKFKIGPFYEWISF